MKKSKHSGNLSSPMRGRAMPNLKAAPGDYDHDPTPVFSKPRDTGGRGMPERFTEGMHGALPTNGMRPSTSIRPKGR